MRCIAVVVCLFTLTAVAERAGIGVILDKQAGGLLMKFVLPDGPAAQAGLQTGERIVAVDGHSMRGMDLQAAVKQIGGPAGTTVKLMIEGKDQQMRTVEVTRGSYTLKAPGPEAFVGTFVEPDRPGFKLVLTPGPDGTTRFSHDAREFDGIGIAHQNPNFGTWQFKGIMQVRSSDTVHPKWRGLCAHVEIEYVGNGALQFVRAWRIGQDAKYNESFYLVPVED